jgi:hypothetical protein
MLTIANCMQILSFSGCSLEFLDILMLIHSVVLHPSHPKLLSEAHKKQLDYLEMRLISVEQSRGSELTTAQSANQDKNIAELYRLAGIVYLHRGGRKSRIGFQPTEMVLRTAFSIIEQLECCDSVWPLFIIGCEARSDEQRLPILQKFSRLLQSRNTSNMESIKNMIEASWSQDDLYEEESQEPDYVLKMNALISANRTLPVFM